MKILLTFTAFFLTVIFIYLACKKPPPPSPPAVNLPPVAKAGADQSFTLASCSDKVNAELDGSGSTDPENKISSYTWKKIAGPEGFTIRNPNSVKTTVVNLSTGEYAFELTVTDAGSLSSKDTVLISVKSTPKEYDLDIPANGTYTFIDNDDPSFGCYFSNNCKFVDRTEIQAKGTFPPLGEFTVDFTEETDTAATSYAPYSTIYIYQDNINNSSLIGTTSVNLKKLIQQGGGAFSGTLTVTNACNADSIKNLPPLTVTGSLDTARGTAALRIKGKAYF